MPLDLIDNVSIDGDTVTFAAAPAFATAYLKDDLRLRYPAGFDLEAVPLSILVAPFFLSVLPSILLSGSCYRVPELDRQLAGIVEPARQYLTRCHPSLDWRGDVSVDRLVDNDVCANDLGSPGAGRVSVLFTGGVDSYHSLLAHLDRNPLMVAIRGADMPYSAKDRWVERRTQVAAAADGFGLEAAFVEANLFEFIAFERKPLKSWWIGAQYGLSLISVCLPLVHAMGGSTMVIAASGTATRPGYPGSHPDFEGAIRCAGIATSHHGYENDRQQKIAAIIETCGQRGYRPPPLHVCLRAYQTDRNCCRCEKCLRTITALIAEGADPQQFGFDISVDETVERVRTCLTDRRRGLTPVVAGHWAVIQDRIVALSKYGGGPAVADEYRTFIEWLPDVDLKSCIAWHRRRQRFRDTIKRILNPVPGVVRLVMDAERRTGRTV